MSQAERLREMKDDARRIKREKTRMDTRQGFKKRQPIDVGDIDPELFKAVIGVVLRSGGALRIGSTRDGGAWAFGLYLDGDYRAEYVGSDESINDYLRDLGGFFGEAVTP